MKLLNKVKDLQENIKGLKKLREDLLEKNLADSVKIQSLESEISNLKNGINDIIDELEKFIDENHGNL